MMKSHSFSLAALCMLALAAPAQAADPVPADASRPAIGTRVGGSPADAEFRAAIQRSGDDYRQKRDACRKVASAERGGCLNDAKAVLAKERAEAKAVHDQAVRAARAARAARAPASQQR